MSPTVLTPESVSEVRANASITPTKPRSCLVCRQRKVRCDKQSPCSNCRRGTIACISPSTIDHPPRWARRLKEPPSTNPIPATIARDNSMRVDQLMDRVNTLESLVQELKHQLGQPLPPESSDKASVTGSHSSGRSTREDHASESSSKAGTNNVHTQVGRLVLQDESHSRYVSSSFWSRVDDELNGLRMAATNTLLDDDSDSPDHESPGQQPSVSQSERTAAERHAFIFALDLNPANSDLRELHPLPSQVPFLLETFGENVNYFLGIVHMPTVSDVVRDWRKSGMKSLSPSNEALLFAIYYATIASMEEEDVMTNFGASKYELNLKYRRGLEQALAKPDFLNAPDIVLVQAFTIFLYLSRRYDSPRYIWMMTGFVIRMAHYLGLHRDGAHFDRFTPYDVERRRRAWWGVCLLDIRASEDQGTDLTIMQGSFDTKLPLNINDSDISSDTKETPLERQGLTDMSVPRLSAHMTNIMRDMMSRGIADGVEGMQEQSRSVDEIYRKLDEEYLQRTAGSTSIVSWVAVNLVRMVMAKMTLIVFLPVLFSSPSEKLTEEIRTRLLCAAIEVAEYNHALNAEHSGRHLRWLYQTCTHWHAIVYLLIEISRRPWSPFVERAWTALHSSWLIPAPSPTAGRRGMWIPLRKLMEKARRHRDAEITRLRCDQVAVVKLELEAQNAPTPSSPGLLGAGPVSEAYRQRWRQLVTTPVAENSAPALATINVAMPSIDATIAADGASSGLMMPDTQAAAPMGPTADYLYGISAAVTNPAIDFASAPWTTSSDDVVQTLDMGPVDASMDIDSDMDWHNWIESAKGMESAAGDNLSSWYRARDEGSV
ncbi:hypothetical protein ASPACDRAFT_47951 [Aspergillus aculeatus ATCC 16872]|uniref:Zn(2)-C6 fungal-type domain-containing protein n=1 Tax=Aspergillus aculeatus (strain ATCC 16872 / CBS 172.66 / WB 5094) TaxID=690307 RepID=A0A1L9WGB0_ASPA1|nr:uncharacterized protein ASPACDRAFT_47951 [Aspergillus aculeatus ATCC 16872]OJJ95206.1 hypothetical protein ASPACDRAFT_47951 [Aspergillus aculeatus ATCC 16872]